MAAAGDPAGRAGGNVADATHDLYRQYGRQIYAYCLHHLGSREEAEDAVQTTFLNAFRGLQRGTVARCEQAWLYKIAQNVCFARRASAGRRLRVEAPNDFDILQEIVPSKSTTESLELMGLDEALEKMPENQRRAILLREWQGLSYREIAEQLDLSQGAVEMLIFRARRSLATALEQPAADARKTGEARSGWSLGSLVAAMKSLFSGAAAVKMAAVAVSAAVVSTSTAHSVVHRFMRDISSAHQSAAMQPTATAAVALASVTVSPASARTMHPGQLTTGKPTHTAHSTSVATTAAGDASRQQPVLVQDEPAPASADAAGTAAAATTSATAAAAASSSAPARTTAPATPATAQGATASANAAGKGATTAPRVGGPTTSAAPVVPSSTATVPGASSSTSSGSGGAGGTSTAGGGSTGSSAKGGGGGHKDKHGHGHGKGAGGGSSSGGGSSGATDPSGGSTTTTPAPDPAGDGSGDTSSSTSGSTDTTTTSTTETTTTTTTTTTSGSDQSGSSGWSSSGDSSGSSDSGGGNGHHHGGSGGGDGGNGGGGGGGHHGGHGH